ncbi:Ig-like domain-containing protein [Georgenia yuyongxinii]|uniref:Ig-like domain repeat protein n=1 Tax=Georgenia yuyongxinii TaxID=2589797 RepID=A0A552WUY4_9MICO|nr:Ig-like domain-containing protein [Georgenia yuyongxinii]TRW46516.1 Ig-like domain repeat protein [Georgenia yuyongxinii]
MNGIDDTRRRAGHVRALSVAAAAVALSLAVAPGAQAITPPATPEVPTAQEVAPGTLESISTPAATPRAATPAAPEAPVLPAASDAAAVSKTAFAYQVIEYGRAGQLSASVTVDGAPATVGHAVFTIGDEAQAPVTVRDGHAVLTVPAGRAGGYYPVTVSYSADGVESSSASGRFKVSEAGVKPSAAFQPGEFKAGETVKIVGKIVAERAAAGGPAGEVQLWSTGVNAGPLSDPVALAANGAYEFDWVVPEDAKPGLHRVWVRYHGDGNFTKSNFYASGTVVEAPAATSETVYEYQAIEYGRAGQLQASVTVDGAAATSGEVVFTIGDEAQFPVAVREGQAVLEVPAGRAVGYHDVTVAYSADGVAPSEASGRYKVFEADVDNTATFEPGEFTAGETVKVVGNVTAEPGNEQVPTGQVQLWDNGPNGGALGAPANLGEDGEYELDWTVPEDAKPGLHRVGVRYLGDGSFRRWNFYAEGRVVEAAQTVTVSASAAAMTYGTTGELVATVATEDGQPVTGGTVTFVLNGRNAEAEVVDGRATVAVTTEAFGSRGWALNHGGYWFNAAFSGEGYTDANASAKLEVVKADVQVEAAITPAKFKAGEKVTVEGRVTALPGNEGQPQGTIRLVVDGENIGSAVRLAGDGSFSVTFTAPKSWKPGTQAVQLTFDSNANFNDTTADVEGTVVKAGGVIGRVIRGIIDLIWSIFGGLLGR